MAEICGEQYVRRTDETIEYVPCTYIRGHKERRHSWETLKAQDEVDRENARGAEVSLGEWGELPSDVATLLGNITSGHVDAYIEIFLTVLHGRKRALRNTPGFPIQTRRHP